MKFLDEEFERAQAVLQVRVPTWKILLALAYDGPESMYGISKRHNIPYPAVHRATMKLSKTNWIEVAETRTSVKNIHTKIYRLTGEGLLWIFSRIPRKIPPVLTDLSAGDEKDLIRSPRRMGGRSISEIGNLRSQNDILLHFLQEFEIEKIAKVNTLLFPLVFGRWERYRTIGVATHLARIFPETAFSALVEHYHDFKGYRSRFGTLEMIFTYKVYRALLESLAERYASAGPGWRLYLKYVEIIGSEIPQVCTLFEQIRLELEKELKESLSFLAAIGRDTTSLKRR